METKSLPRYPKLLRASLLAALAFGLAGLGWGQTVVVNPSSPWTVPANVTSIKVEVWGGGGGGGGAFRGAGGGGGGGAYRMVTLSVSPGQTFTIVRGTGGTVGANTNGGNGGVTTVSGTPGTVTANGGAGGTAGTGGCIWILCWNSTGSGGNGGSGGIHSGGNGGTSSGNGAGGGGGAGNNGNGGNGDNAVTGTGGAGDPNNAPYIGGSGGAFISSNGNGNAGTGPGGGGSGARSWDDATNRAGGAGAPGQVVITYDACPAITATVADKSNVSCYAGADGSITITASGGVGPYEYSIYNGSTGTYQSSNTFTGLEAGTYYPRVKDANGCESPSCP